MDPIERLIWAGLALALAIIVLIGAMVVAFSGS